MRHRQRTDRAMARPGALSRRLRPRRRIEPTTGPACRRGDPVHQGPCDRAAVLAIAWIAVHRPLPAEQWPHRPGPPRLGIPQRHPDPAADAIRIRLVLGTFRYAARDILSEAAGFRRV